jgi:hypothetical protein
VLLSTACFKLIPFAFVHVLQVYDVLTFSVGPFLESGLVPLVLAPIWVLYGYLYPLLDEYFDDESIGFAGDLASNPRFVALLWASLAAMFILSDVLYLNNVPHWQVCLLHPFYKSLSSCGLVYTRMGVFHVTGVTHHARWVCYTWMPC